MIDVNWIDCSYISGFLLRSMPEAVYDKIVKDYGGSWPNPSANNTGTYNPEWNKQKVIKTLFDNKVDEYINSGDSKQSISYRLFMLAVMEKIPLLEQVDLVEEKTSKKKGRKRKEKSEGDVFSFETDNETLSKQKKIKIESIPIIENVVKIKSQTKKRK